VLENGLNGLVIAAQQYHVLVEGFDLANELDSIYQENGTMHVLPAQCIQKLVLQVLSLAHDDLSRKKRQNYTTDDTSLRRHHMIVPGLVGHPSHF
jgi:hypothetical protein